VSELPPGTVTFLFTDVEASTDLVRRHGEGYVALQASARGLLRAAFTDHGGREVDTQGDSFFVVFTRARDAVLAAVAAQRSLAAHPWPEDGVLRVRMGLHTAEPHLWEEGYVGIGVHRAARICGVGHGGQILLSRSTAGLIDDDEIEGIALRDLGGHRLKGLQNAERIFQLVLDGLPNEFPPLDTLEGAGRATETGTILFGDVQAFTALTHELPSDLFRELVANLHKTLTSTLENAGGRGVLVFGDGVMGVFRSARAAIAAALHLRLVFGTHDWPGGRRFHVNIGLHSGEVVATAYGHFGVAVNRGSKVCSCARDGQIIVSEATRSLLDGDEDFVLRELASDETIALKLPFRLYELIAPDTIEPDADREPVRASQPIPQR